MSYSGFSSNYKNPVVAAAGSLGTSSKFMGDQAAAFRNNKYVSGATDFLWSNSVIAKISFLILIVLCCCCGISFINLVLPIFHCGMMNLR